MLDDKAIHDKKARHRQWLSSNGYEATGVQTWEKFTMFSHYKLTLNYNGRWYCHVIGKGTTQGAGRTPWTAENRAIVKQDKL